MELVTHNFLSRLMEIHSTSVGNLKLLNPKFQNPTEVQWDFFIHISVLF
jgi:hypothetical protein